MEFRFLVQYIKGLEVITVTHITRNGKGSSLNGSKRTLINIIKTYESRVKITGNGKYIVKVSFLLW